MIDQETTIFDIELDPGVELRCFRAQGQPYNDGCISAGLVYGHPADTLYLRFEGKDEEEEATTIFLRLDEAMAVIYCLSGAMWTQDRYASNGQTADIEEYVMGLKREDEREDENEDNSDDKGPLSEGPGSRIATEKEGLHCNTTTRKDHSGPEGHAPW